MHAIILAGGKGTRLRPYTTILPKPLMPVGDLPILEIVIRQLKKAGFKRITFAVGYLAELLEAYFGNGSKWGVEISYSREQEPLGTAGPISLIDDIDENFLVMNGDILTTLDYSDLMHYHSLHDSMATICVFSKKVQINLGVLKIDQDQEIRDYIEKPSYSYQVSMGIYAFNREVLKYIPQNIRLDFPDLICRLIDEGHSIQGYLFSDYWRDIGTPEDYQLALDEFEEKKEMFL